MMRIAKRLAPNVGGNGTCCEHFQFDGISHAYAI
jgi:hypothetical protein